MFYEILYCLYKNGIYILACITAFHAKNMLMMSFGNKERKCTKAGMKSHKEYLLQEYDGLMVIL